MRTLPTYERLHELFNYDESTGNLTRKTKGRGRNCQIGDVAGGVNGQGYIYVRVDKQKLRAHRLIWLMCTGSWPKHEIDHINRDRSDNRICNLRDVPSFMNQNNRKNNII